MKDYDMLIKQKQSAIQKEKEELERTKEELKREKNQRAALEAENEANDGEQKEETEKKVETTENAVRCFICGGAHYAKFCPKKKEKADEKDEDAKNDESLHNFSLLLYS